MGRGVDGRLPALSDPCAGRVPGCPEPHSPVPRSRSRPRPGYSLRVLKNNEVSKGKRGNRTTELWGLVWGALLLLLLLFGGWENSDETGLKGSRQRSLRMINTHSGCIPPLV